MTPDQITEYQLRTCSFVHSLQLNVRMDMLGNWYPLGGPIHDHCDQFSQAMVRYRGSPPKVEVAVETFYEGSLSGDQESCHYFSIDRFENTPTALIVHFTVIEITRHSEDATYYRVRVKDSLPSSQIFLRRSLKERVFAQDDQVSA